MADTTGCGWDPENDESLQKLEARLDAPKKIVGDEGSVEEFDVGDQIRADSYKRHFDACRVPFGMRIAVARPAGTVQ